MSAKQIKSIIEHAIKDEERTGRLAGTLKKVSRNNGAKPTKQQIEGVVNFVKKYAQSVPSYLEEGIAAAREVGLVAEMNQMTSELEAYWLEEEDLIPDHLGLLGVMDDAYASLLLLQSVSDYSNAVTGCPLLAQNLTSANRLIRQLIGEPTASILDQRVGVSIGHAVMNRLVNQFAARELMVGSGFDRSWGGVSLKEYVDIQMGALGFV